MLSRRGFLRVLAAAAAVPSALMLDVPAAAPAWSRTVCTVAPVLEHVPLYDYILPPHRVADDTRLFRTPY